MNDISEPLTPRDCNLRGFGWMPLDVHRLLDSDLWILSTGDEFKAAVALWAKAWSQVPAGSLPNDDRLLAHLSGAGPNWPAVKAMALRGFVLCSDGRLYHSVLASKALEAWNEREKGRERQRKWRERSSAETTADDHVTVTSPSPNASRDGDVIADRTVQDTTLENSRGNVTTHNSEQPPGPDSPGPRAKRGGDRGSRLPDDWTLSGEDRAFASDLGIDPDREAASFRDYWTSKPGAAGRKSNWSATWRNWVRRATERKTGNVSGNRHRNGFIVLAEKRAREDRERAAGGTVIDLIEDDGRGSGRGGWR